MGQRSTKAVNENLCEETAVAMTKKILEKYQALLESGAITQEEFDRIAAETPPEAPDSSDASQDQPVQLRLAKDCCSAVMLISVLTLAMTLLFIPQAPKLNEYDIGNALLYTVGKLSWLARGIHGCILTFALALRARNLYQNTAAGIGGTKDYRPARRTLIWAAALLAVLVLHQAYRYCHPLGTP